MMAILFIAVGLAAIFWAACETHYCLTQVAREDGENQPPEQHNPHSPK